MTAGDLAAALATLRVETIGRHLEPLGEAGLTRGLLDFPDQPPTLDLLAGMPDQRMLNRTRGAGTRVLLDLLLDEIAVEKDISPVELRAGIAGYNAETRSHNAVAAAVASGRADWGLGIEAVAVAYDLGFAPLRDEEYDFLTLQDRLDREPVQAFLEVLRSVEFRTALGELPGFVPDARTGEPK